MRSLPAWATAARSVARLALASVVIATPAGLTDPASAAAPLTITTVAGTGTAGSAGDGGPATSGQLALPIGIAQVPGGGYVIADQANNRVRRVTAGGTITTVAGSGTPGFSGDGGPATAAQFNAPSGVAVLSDGSILVGDANNNRVRKVSPGGTITTAAGTGGAGLGGDGGPATAALLSFPFGITVLPDDSYLIADVDNNRIRKVSPTGVITTVAGTTGGFGGDGGPATSAQLNEPFAATRAADGGLLIADTQNNRIRRVTPGGIISTVAGTGAAGAAGDTGPATAAQLNFPTGVTATAGGDFLVADRSNNKVRAVTGGVIRTVAGTGAAGSAGDGGAGPSAQVNGPYAITFASDGDLLVAETIGHRIRRVDLTDGATPTPTPTPTPAPVPPAPPTVGSEPRLTGTPAPGRSLTCVAGQYGGSPAPARSIVWELAPRDVTGPADPAWKVRAGETGTTYPVREIEVGFRVRCREIAVNTTGTATAPSNSLRVDLGPPGPKDGLGPKIDPVAVVGQPITCLAGDWVNAGEYAFSWRLDGSVVATGETFTPRAADRGGQLVCQVVGSNDVGSSGPAESAPARVIATVPKLTRLPRVSIASTGPKPTDRLATCDPGGWRDDFEQYTFSWFRGEDGLLPGETGPTYRIRVEDLGGTIRCQVISTNPLGPSTPHKANARLVPLPTAGAEGRMFTAVNGKNWLSSTSMLPVSAEQLSAMKSVIDARYAAILAQAREACKFGGKIPIVASTFDATFGLTLPAGQTCFVLNTSQPLITTADGVFWQQRGCYPVLATSFPSTVSIQNINSFSRYRAPGPPRDISGTPICPKLGIDIPRFDPARAREIDNGIATAIAAAAPIRILWDFNGDGRAEAECGSDAPILRTIPERGKYPNLRAILVNRDSEETGVYGIAATNFDFAFGEKNDGALRSNQLFACRTEMDPPADPKLPCVKEAAIGRVRLEGNLCPVQSRNIPPAELGALPEDIQTVLRSKNLMANSDASQLSRSQLQAAGRALMGDPGEGPFAKAAAVGTDDQNLALNYTEAISDFSDPADLNTGLGKFGNRNEVFLEDLSSEAQARKIELMTAVAVYKPEAAVFATDQIYVGQGKIKVNGVTVDPVGGALALVPSDVDAAVSSVKAMTIASSKAALSMASKQVDLPIGEAKKLAVEFKDSVTAPVQQFAEANLDQMSKTLEERLDIGPFKLADQIKVKLEKDGTASISASASLPIFTDLEGRSLKAKVDISATRSGALSLKTINIKAPSALLGPVELRNLNILYDGGLSVTGQVIFGPNNSGIDITRFRLSNGGTFEAFGLKYNAGAGEGIPIGPGVFLTQIGGEFDLPGLDFKTGQIKAYAAVSAGQSVGRGCPAAGLEGDVTLKWDRQMFAIDACAEPKIVCVSFGKVTFHADTNGFFQILGDGGIKLGPIKVSAYLNGQFQLAKKFSDSRFQVFMEGNGEIAGILEGQVKAMVSNKGIAGCGSITVVKVPLIDELFGETVKVTIAGGAGVRFINGLPPITPVQLLAGIRIFTGCDLGDFRTFAGSRAATGTRAQAGARVVPMPAGKKTVALSVVGSGGVPRFTMKTQDGRVLDYTTVPEKLTAMPTGSVAMAIPAESRTVVMFAEPEQGDYTLQPAPGSPPIADVQMAESVPDPVVKARVEGRGSARVLRYDVKRIPGQSVRFVEASNGASKEIETVNGGGKGQQSFTVSEATRPGGRTIVAEVSQGGLPRTQLKLATFSAPNLRVAKVRGLRIKRSGRSKATISWQSAPGATTYLVRITRPGGIREVMRPLPGKRSVTVTGLASGEALTVRVVGVSAGGREGLATTVRSGRAAR